MKVHITTLTSAMRAYVTGMMGQFVEMPDLLLR